MMTDTPERIWINLSFEDGCAPVETNRDECGKFFNWDEAQEYTRSDLCAVAIQERDELDFLLNEGGEDSVANLIKRAEKAEAERDADISHLASQLAIAIRGMENAMFERDAALAQVAELQSALVKIHEQTQRLNAKQDIINVAFEEWVNIAMKGTPNE
jgi:hypothetical protein